MYVSVLYIQQKYEYVLLHIIVMVRAELWSTDSQSKVHTDII